MTLDELHAAYTRDREAVCLDALKRHRGNVTLAARELGISPRRLQQLISPEVRNTLRTTAK